MKLKKITTGAAISVTGTLVESKGAGQKFEIQVVKLKSLEIQMQRSSNTNKEQTKFRLLA
jgi:aspartyl/asparaginyl-tRNA synthetase